MARLEDLTRGTQVRGLHPDDLATIVDVQWHGSACVEITWFCAERVDRKGEVGYCQARRGPAPAEIVLCGSSFL